MTDYIGPATWATIAPHFFRHELTCPGAPSEFPFSIRTLQWNERIRAVLGGYPIGPTSGFRTPEYNATLPGHSAKSRHLFGLANDLGCNDQNNAFEMFAAALLTCDRTHGAGIGLYRMHIHIDTDPARGEILIWRMRDGVKEYQRFPLEETT